jgi:alkanesulfonate monooxygenase SsuD/methylene tetrahydromethanopterin reductase-like flavin-dependent oxidoreductase (luciferase family)
MSVRGEWAEMAELVSDDMLNAFAVVGEYDEVAEMFARRYAGLLDEVSFTLYAAEAPEESQIRKIVQRLKEAPSGATAGPAGRLSPG